MSFRAISEFIFAKTGKTDPEYAACLSGGYVTEEVC